ncbi:hypothetical protein [Pollutimonas bauzanensis]|uniref:Uncharacterized protein n=1 Tax=Pollutimonas bauzanensis TaxID=658167 RepID=A0A1M5YIX3_9BURK|nr:hypothetical protein [Pollutimonas bauzanensis]SHI11946.1 hypothetical protein SAMN04488135_109136 [Pollutimonas bauzanensis]
MIRIKKPYRMRAQRLYENRLWHRAHSALRRYSGLVKGELLVRWRAMTGADDPARLLSMMHQYDNGKLASEVDKRQNTL